MKGKTFARVSLLHYSIMVMKIEVMHYFLMAGADPNVLLSNEWTSLHLAAFLGLTDFIELLIFFSAKIDLSDRYGMSPIHVAIQAGEVAAVQSLLRGGANITNSPVALNLAVACGDYAIVKLLMQFGADPEKKNRAGKTTFELLEKPEQNEIEEVLRTVRPFDRSKGAVIPQITNPPVTTFSDMIDRLPPPRSPQIVQKWKVIKV